MNDQGIPPSFPEINFLSQNMLSFNISTKNQKTVKKLNAITKDKCEIIFLSDIRLNSYKQNYSIHDLEKKITFKGYDFYHNSKRSSRGVGILISKKLNYKVNNQMSDFEDNYLLLDITITDYRLIIGAIYGPNSNDPNFYNNLNTDLKFFNCSTIILGGDWNATWDTSVVQNNLDVLNMVSLPSKFRSDQIKKIAGENGLVEPFRTLNPEKIDFSFIPNINTNINRSRIDFFLISQTVMEKCKNSYVSPSLLSEDFDHKAVLLDFRKKVFKTKDKIKDTILKSDILNKLVHANALDCYLNHLTINENFTYEMKTNFQQEVGHLFSKIKELKDFQMRSILENTDHLIEFKNLETAKLNIIENLFASLPNLAIFENMPIDCTYDVFFEILVMQIKSTALSFQSFYYKLSNVKKDQLRKKLKQLKISFHIHQNEIRLLESELANIEENELKDELKLLKNFERLNNEKITPYFLNLAKKPGHTETVELINDDNGSPFLNTKDRGKYITDFYSKLYQKPDGIQEDNVSINDFLEDISTHPEVLSSKLSDEEKNFLDRPFTIEELDNSNSKSKKNSSPGIDGISNRFIDKFWSIFRVPLFKYATHCFESGKLTDNFRSAKIRLIPKKGNLTQIKNWRPISLLNCFYKVISRAITLRIRKYIDKITKVGQKGYSSTKQCQEVLICLLDEIQKAKASNKKGALLSLDIKKAFDSISHEYLLKAYKFFNFGDYIIKWLKLIGTNRKACIIMEDESLSPFFNLDRGNAQGDNISPFSFNIGFQILIFKLNFDLQIARLNEPLVIPPLIADPHIGDPPAPVKGLERKAFSFADDGSCLTLLEPNSLVRIYNILEIFGSLSGLVCNVEKTALVVIGHEGPLDPRIADIGFTLQTEVTILGLKIKGDNYDFSETFDGFCDKIRKIIQHWARFNLSLPGRINVAKCFLYSQLNYIGCFLTIPQNYLTVIQNLIETFIIGNLKLAKKRLYAKPEDGGLGLFQMNEFLEAQQCQWIKRAKNMDEIWKQKLYVKCKGDISNAKSKFFDQTTEPTLYNIVKCYEKFSINFTKYKENFWLANLFENKALPINFRLQNCLTEEELGFDTFLNFGTLIRKLTIEQLYLPTRSRMMSRAQVMEHLGIQFTPEDFEKIKKICNNAKLKYTKNKIDEKKSISVNGFLALKTKGSKIFRKILLNQTKSSITKNIVKFAETTETFINLEESKLLNKCWNC